MSDRLRVSVTTPARVDPVSLVDAKLHCRIDDGTENAALALMIKSATAMCETWMRRPIMTQSFKAYLDEWPLENWVQVPKAPLVGVTAVRTYNDADVATVFPSTSYFVDMATTPGRIVLRSGYSWPTHSRLANPIEIEFRAGYGDEPAAVPAEIRHAVLATIAYFYENRGDAVAGLPATAEILLAAHRDWVF